MLPSNHYSCPAPDDDRALWSETRKVYEYRGQIYQILPDACGWRALISVHGHVYQRPMYRQDDYADERFVAEREIDRALDSIEEATAAGIIFGGAR